MNPEELLLRQIMAEQTVLREKLSQLDARIESVRRGMVPAKPAEEVPPVTAAALVETVAQPPPLPAFVPTVAPPPVATRTKSQVAPKDNLEMRLGQVWFVRIGIAAILTGLVLGSVYAYKNFIHTMPPLLKVLALYVVSFGLAGLGLWLERSRESLRTFGRVLTAGGFAAIFYTTYAMHHVEMLRVIESPLWGGLLLLICALGIFIYAERKEDATVAALSLVLGYYSTAINPIGTFSLFANLVLTLGGLWLLLRRRWTSTGSLSLVGCYGGFAFWQYVLPLWTTGQLAPVHYWAGQGFLMGCWTLFTATFLLVKAETLGMAARSVLAALNNAAFFVLFTMALLAKTPVLERLDAFALFAMIWGVLLLALCYLAEKLHGAKGRPLSEIFFACGLLQLALALAIKLSGYQLATVFALEAAFLLWLGLQQNRMVAKVGAVLLALAVWFLNLQASVGRDTLVLQDTLASVLQGFVLIAAAWWSARQTLIERKGRFSPLAFVFCLVGMTVLLMAVVQNDYPVWQPAAMILLCAALLAVGKIPQVSFPELSLAASVGALLLSFFALGESRLSRLPELWFLLALALLFGATLLKDRWVCSPGIAKTLRWMAGIQSALAYLHWWGEHEADWFPLAVTVMGLLLMGLARRRASGPIATFALIFLALGLAGLLASLVGSHDGALSWGWLVPLLAMGSEWILRHSTVYGETRRGVLGKVTVIAAIAALWVYLTYHLLAEGSYRTMAWAGMALVIFVAGLLLKHATYRRCGLAVLALALGRIVFFDVWQLDTAARFASFLVIGAVLVGLGFFYNRFEHLIRKLL
jgi:uncharacterized membrane protein